MKEPCGGEASHFARIADALAGPGWCVIPDFIPPIQVEALGAEARALACQGAFRAAGIGRGEGQAVRTQVRSDRICWLDPGVHDGALGVYLGRLEELRQTLNRELTLGLFDFEGHLALYPTGSCYRRHLDQFQGWELRILTVILYLNAEWRSADGGTLRLYTDPVCPDGYVEIAPRGGTLVTFLSARFEHEVMPAVRERLSLTGWFKRRG